VTIHLKISEIAFSHWSTLSPSLNRSRCRRCSLCRGRPSGSFSEISSIFSPRYRSRPGLWSLVVAFLKFRIPFPSPSPIWGEFPSTEDESRNDGQRRVAQACLFHISLLLLNSVSGPATGRPILDTAWRKCMGIEPTTDIFCPPTD